MSLVLTKNRIPHFIQTLDAHWHRRSEFLRKKRNPQLLKHIPEFDQFGIVDASSDRQLPLVINGKLTNLGHALGISADDLLVDSLEHSVSTADSDLHRLLLECNEMEEKILTRTVKELKAILYSLGI